ncbi:ABC transporter permease [Microbacterium nanhaiense]|uniref:ABC transporter permease n=1 Tax=Microbacterium nanhaiense TaxID=1301026 RepID=A0ABQ2N5P5_9MICO|nr:ABC transporter ATP-binding protein [Microbacterium nanhaiense]GGO67500.1 ABC transporter permease [Microbacterium nanhaiense]
MKLPLGADPGEVVASLRDVHVSLERNGTRTEILHGIDLDIGRGEIVAVVGESGSGKSVMSMSMLGLLPASARPVVTGQLNVTGVDMTTVSDSELRAVRKERLGVVFQDPMTSLNPTMHVGRQIVEKAGTREEALRLMGAVGIPEPERRFRAYPHELSGGLRQRIMIAMALAGDPQLLIADEPTTALDVTVQAQVLRLLLETRDNFGCAMLFVTHDLGVAAQIADRIIVMHHGEIVEQGTTDQVLFNPVHEYTQGLLQSRITFSTDRNVPLPTMPISIVDPVDAAILTQPSIDTTDLAPKLTINAVAPSEKQFLVKARDVKCVFPVRDDRGRKLSLAALDGVDLSVRQGDSIAIVGESGSGKSTLLRIAGRLENRFSGDLTAPTGKDVQMVFQDPGSSLTPWLTVRQHLHERFRFNEQTAIKEGRARAIMQRVGLPLPVLDARPSELSGGQRQRVSLARATIVPPRLLLCDEPTSALDVSVAAGVLNLINRLRLELGISILFVTHDLAVARMIADTIIVMQRGRIVEQGPADEIIFNPSEEYTRELVRAVPRLTSSEPAEALLQSA